MDKGPEPPDDDFNWAVTKAMAGALDVMLARTFEGDRLPLVRNLRTQMEQVLAEAPLTGELVEAMAIRSRLAALFDAECTRLEATEQKREQP